MTRAFHFFAIFAFFRGYLILGFMATKEDKEHKGEPLDRNARLPFVRPLRLCGLCVSNSFGCGRRPRRASAFFLKRSELKRKDAETQRPQRRKRVRERKFLENNNDLQLSIAKHAL